MLLVLLVPIGTGETTDAAYEQIYMQAGMK